MSGPARGKAGRALAAALLAALFRLAPLAAQPAPGEEGRIVDDAPCDPLPEHAQLDEFGRRYFDAEAWASIRGESGIECRHIHYMAGGARVEGFLLRPAAPASARLPAILYCRGGGGEFGRINAVSLAEMRLLVRAGFVVAATNYRFLGELVRRDEWGGADLDDVLALVPLLRSRPYVDGRNLFLFGLSRGGLMTYLALKRQAPVNGAAVIAGVSDLTTWLIDRPEFVLGFEGFDGWAKIWPDFATRSRQLLQERSAVFWPEKITAPLLILHSRTDTRVPVGQALALAQKLQEAGREYELVVYGEDGHSLPLHRADRNRRIVDWFNAHRVP